MSQETAPTLSICIPTFNRAEILDYCLESLRGFAAQGIPFEVVVSDNASPDDTALVVDKHRRHMSMVYCNQPNKCEPYHGFVNAIRNSTGRHIIYLADDDTLIFEQLAEYVRRLDADPGLTAIFADWIAWDDERGVEMHRYFQFGDPRTFGPADPLGIANFIIGNIVFTEMGVIRRDALLRCDCVGKRIHTQAQRWAYRLSRLGNVAFELEPFYREHRVVQKRFQRGLPDNLRLRLRVIGDEMRNELETILLWAIQDAGLTHVPEDQQLTARRLIDRFLNSRIELEVSRAIAERNWLLALDLRRRHVLWYGPGPDELRGRDIREIAFPAALQVVRDAYYNMTGVAGLALHGFNGSTVRDFFRIAFPEVQLVDPGTRLPAPQRVLVLAKHEASLDAVSSNDGYCFALDRLLQQYSVGNDRIELNGL